MKLNAKFLSFAGLALFIVILFSIDLKKVYHIMLSADIFYVIIGILFLIPEILLRVVSWRQFTLNFSKKYSLAQAFETFAIGQFYGNVTIGKAGDFVKAFDLAKKLKEKVTRSILIIFFDRIITLLLMLFFFICSLTALSLFFDDLHKISYLVLLVLLNFLLVIIICCQFKKAFGKAVNFFLKKILKQDINLAAIKKNILKVDMNWHYILPLILALLISYSKGYFFARSIHIDTSFLMFVLIIPIVAIAENIPISIMGFGLRESAMLVLFSKAGLTSESIIALSFMLFLFSVVPVFLMGLTTILINKIDLKV